MEVSARPSGRPKRVLSAQSAAATMKKILEPLKDIRLIENTVNIKSSLAAGQEAEIQALAEAIAG